MNNIAINDSSVDPSDRSQFTLLYSFEEYISLAKAYIEKHGSFDGISGTIYEILRDADFELIGDYYHDFGENHPHVYIKVFLDDNLYIQQLDRSKPIGQKIEKLLETIEPSHTSKNVNLYPSSLYSGSRKDWRKDPQYQIGETSDAVDQTNMEKIWGPSSALHVFISHKDSIKSRANNLKALLAEYGISAFVAHEDIEPTEEWQDVIEKALFSSDALIALLTKDFSRSLWTDQEVGIAFGRQLPVYPVKMENGVDPYGFIGKIQGFGLKDGIIEKLVEKFLLDERSRHPTIFSLLRSLSKETKNMSAIIGLLSQVEPRTWTESQRALYIDAFDANAKLKKVKGATEIAEKIKPCPPQNEPHYDLDDEIPF